MDFIKYITNYVQRDISYEVLDLALTNRKLGSLNTSMSSKIEYQILRKTFLVDANLIGGLEITIDVSDMIFSHEIDGSTVYTIPDSILQGRRINTVLGITSAGPNKLIAGDTLNAYGTRLTDNHDFVDAESTPDVEMVSTNQILITDSVSHIFKLAVRLVLEYSNRFGEVNPRTYPKLARIALLAVKAEIYVRLNIKINESKLYHGHELSKMRETVDKYEDAFQEYNESLDLLRKLLFMNDKESMSRYVLNLVPNNF